jgi:NAD(P)-dependent dehydrogenase (short-subunit alcohol dehydrogenase family)
MKSFISKLTKLDILVNNAGTNIPEPFLNVKQSSMETILNVNTKAVFNIAQLCANQIIKLKRKSGSIINISSIFGLVAGQKRTVYSMTKFGVEGLTKGMALDLAKYNIRVNSVCPNIVLTPRTKKYFANKKYNKYVKENTLLKKIVTVSDVATSVTFLASEAASMITGASIIIDGGWTSK